MPKDSSKIHVIQENRNEVGNASEANRALRGDEKKKSQKSMSE